MEEIFAGVRVLDFTQAYSGPFCTCHLADFGAEVIKVEMPGTGDMTRTVEPAKNGKSGYFTFCNRNKKSITLNLKKDKGRQLFFELLKGIDVIVENFRPGTMKKLGMDYEEVCKKKPDIIYASLSGFGQNGPYRNRASFALIAEAVSGHMDFTGFTDGPPIKNGLSIGDTFGGAFTFAGIAAALFHREKTGEGQYIDISMADSLFSATEMGIIEYSMGCQKSRIGNTDPTIAPYDCYRAKDGWYVIGAGLDPHFIKLCECMGKPELANDPRYSTVSARKDPNNEKALFDLINQWSSHKTRKELEEILEPLGIPSSPVLSVGEACENEQFQAREMIKKLHDPVMGAIKVAGVPIKMSKTPGSIKKSAPELGEHNREIYCGLGLSTLDIKQLTEEGIL